MKLEIKKSIEMELILLEKRGRDTQIQENEIDYLKFRNKKWVSVESLIQELKDFETRSWSISRFIKMLEEKEEQGK